MNTFLDIKFVLFSSEQKGIFICFCFLFSIQLSVRYIYFELKRPTICYTKENLLLVFLLLVLLWQAIKQLLYFFWFSTMYMDGYIKNILEYMLLHRMIFYLLNLSWSFVVQHKLCIVLHLNINMREETMERRILLN